MSAFLQWTLGAYFFRKFSASILAVFAISFFLIFVLNIIELTRISNDVSGSAFLLAIEISVLTTPAVAEQTFPFAALFGSLFTFLALARNRELVVARAAGMSVWQFLGPAIMAGFLLGTASTLILDPVAAMLKTMSEAAISPLGGESSKTLNRDIWLRQKSVDGQAIIRADIANLTTSRFDNVTVFEFDLKGEFIHRVHAEYAQLNEGFWLLRNARVISPGAAPEYHDSYELSTLLSIRQVNQSLSEPDTISFYSLRDWAIATDMAGLDAARYFQQFHTLLARPLFFIAMILVSATVSLKFSRTGTNPLSILAGILTGFLFYVLSKLMSDFGSAGMLSPFMTAFLPPLLTCLLGSLVLLYLEDG